MNNNGKASATLHAAFRRRAAITAEAKKLQEEYEKKLAALDAEGEAIDKAIEVLNAAAVNYLCPRCGGDGTLRQPDGAGQMEDIPCPDCRGTGLRLK